MRSSLTEGIWRGPMRVFWWLVVAALGVLVLLVTAGILPATAHTTRAVHAIPPAGSQPKVFTAPACRVRHTRSGLPALGTSDATPDRTLGTILSIAPQPAAGKGLAAVGAFDREPIRVLTVFKRFVRIVAGQRNTRLAFLPTIICNETDFTRPGHLLPQRIVIAPEQAIVMVVLSNPPPRTAILAGSASTIRNGPALPGLGLPHQRGWIQATVVPDGVARVVMHFTPPFLHHYTATATIQNNIGIVVRKPDYTPTIVSWYAADGHLIHTFVNHRDLRYDQCLSRHRRRCTD